MATEPLRSGFAETSSSHRVLGSPLWYRVGPWPAILGWTAAAPSGKRGESTLHTKPVAPRGRSIG